MLCDQLNATEYISAPGSRDYLIDSDSFKKRNITVTYHHYNHPVYTQLFGTFMPYMSVIDLLFNKGPESLNIIVGNN